jgi:hypothetical protein
MAETENIARLAEIVSSELFSRFFWRTTGARNQNWPCEKAQHGRKTHPSDVVFHYDEPYSLRRTYVNCDLKSYASGSITAGAVVSAVQSLASALGCIEVSETWSKLYGHHGFTPSIAGLLFIFNHDGDYDKNFDQILAAAKPAKITLPKGTQIAIFGPQQIRWLDNVSHEIVYMRGTKELPDDTFCRFEYPHLVRKKKVQVELAKAATLEMLTGPWITLAYDAVEDRRPGVVVFYARRGDTTEEFLYLIDYLMHYQMVHPGVDIRIKSLEPDPSSAALFEKAALRENLKDPAY